MWIVKKVGLNIFKDCLLVQNEFLSNRISDNMTTSQALWEAVFFIELVDASWEYLPISFRLLGLFTVFSLNLRTQRFFSHFKISSFPFLPILFIQ